MDGNSYSLNQTRSIYNFIKSKALSFQSKQKLGPLDISIQKNRINTSNNDARKSDSLSDFWNRLVTTPKSYQHNPNATVSLILQKEKDISASKIIKSVLSRKLGLLNNSKAIQQEVLEKCHKIFHEDFPGDFILEHNGDRLGLFLMDTCYDTHGKAHINYKFEPSIKDFSGLF